MILIVRGMQKLTQRSGSNGDKDKLEERVSHDLERMTQGLSLSEVL